MTKQNIVLIEPSHIISEGMRRIIESAVDLSLIHTAEKASNIDVHIHKADVVILDPRVSSEEDLPNLLRNLRKKNEEISIIALHTHYQSAATMKHFDCVIDLENDTPTVLQKIRETQSQEKSASSESNDLSLREKEVLVSVAKGLTNKEIANALNISIHTVIAHRKKISSKIGIKSIPGLTLYAMTNGML